MTLKGRLGTSLTLILALAATFGLFNYALQYKKDSVETLQAQLQDLKLQRLEEDKGKQAATSAQQAAERFNAYLDTTQKKLEALADAAPLRQPHDKVPQRKAKESAFLSLVRADATWAEGVLVDQTGAVIALTAPGVAGLGATPEFREVSRQRMTVVRLVEQRGRGLVLQITAPCLSNTGVFLGAVQTATLLSPALLEKVLNQPGLINWLGTPSGRRLTPVAPENFPNNLGALMNKDLQQMEAFLARSGPSFFRANWGSTRYLVGTAETRIPGIRVFTLLEVGGLEKLIGSDVFPESFASDPVIVVGLVLILAAGLGLMMMFSGGGGSGLRKLSRELAEQLQNPEGGLTPITGPAGEEEQRLTDVINLLIERAGAKPSAAAVNPGDALAVSRLQDELAELRQARDQVTNQNQNLQDQIALLTQQAEDLRQAAAAAPAAVAAPESSRLRIEAIVNMSDDLKATLTVIKNYISSILSSEEGKITDAQQEFLGVVINKSARLERQINDLLDLSHLESEAGQLFMVPTDMSAMIQDVILNSQAQADTKQIQLQQTLPSVLTKIMVNSDRLGQVLINLVQHALRVTPVGGTVNVEIEEGGGEQVLRIIDGGAPATPDQAEAMFVRFHGVDSPAGAALAGSGLRFAIIREIVHAHHGRIEIRAHEGSGNEIRLTLPVPPEGEQIREMPRPEFFSTAAEASAPASDAGSGGDALQESYFDLSAFMQDQPPEASAPALKGGGEELDELLKNIEDVDAPKES